MAVVRSLKAEKRQRTGSGVLNQMRREGFVPSVVYGAGKEENVNVKISEKAFNDLIKEAPSADILLDLDVEGEVTRVFIQDIQFNSLRNQIMHADFLAVKEDTLLSASIPVVLTGEPAGVKLGGLLEQLLYKINIKCVPEFLPETITTDVEHLDVSQAHHISEVTFPEGVIPMLPPKTVVALVAKTRVAQSSEAGEEETEATAETAEA